MERKALQRLEPGLPARWYYDPAHYARELEVFWYGRWIAVARTGELAAPGDWRVVRIGTQSLVIVSGEKGKLRAFHNTCRHRGSVLCTEEAGNFARRRIVCPYHAWTYDLAGQLVATPRRMETPDFDMRALRLYPAAVDTWGGFVFLNLAGEAAAPLRQSLGELPQRFARYGFERLAIGKRIVAEVKANWKLLAENFSECFHCPPVHPELCRVVTAYRDAGAWGLRGPESKGEYAAGAETLTLDGRARLPAIAGLTEEERRTIYVPAMLPPGLFQLATDENMAPWLAQPLPPAGISAEAPEREIELPDSNVA